VIFVEIARPPRDVGKLAGEFDDVLARAAAGLDGVTGFPSKKPRQNATDSLVVAVKGGRIEPSVGCTAAAILAKFNDIVDHESLLESGAIRVVRR
jgi:hypothetical protein